MTFKKSTFNIYGKFADNQNVKSVDGYTFSYSDNQFGLHKLENFWVITDIASGTSVGYVNKRDDVENYLKEYNIIEIIKKAKVLNTYKDAIKHVHGLKLLKNK